MTRLPPAWLLTPVVLVASTSGYAVDYLTVQQAQAVILPDRALSEVKIRLSSDQRKAIQAAAGLRVRNESLNAWRAASGEWFLVDEVLGKHEFITYACGIAPDGSIVGIEILSYRETYGGEIREPRWRSQFVGKTAGAPLKLDQDIKNISGATLSCRHVSDGVKRLLATHALVLKTLR